MFYVFLVLLCACAPIAYYANRIPEVAPTSVRATGRDDVTTFTRSQLADCVLMTAGRRATLSDVANLHPLPTFTLIFRDEAWRGGEVGTAPGLPDIRFRRDGRTWFVRASTSSSDVNAALKVTSVTDEVPLADIERAVVAAIGGRWPQAHAQRNAVTRGIDVRLTCPICRASDYAVRIPGEVLAATALPEDEFVVQAARLEVESQRQGCRCWRERHSPSGVHRYPLGEVAIRQRFGDRVTISVDETILVDDLERMQRRVAEAVAIPRGLLGDPVEALRRSAETRYSDQADAAQYARNALNNGQGTRAAATAPPPRRGLPPIPPFPQPDTSFPAPLADNAADLLDLDDGPRRVAGDPEVDDTAERFKRLEPYLDE